MGAPTGTAQSAYPTAGQVMNRARAFVNDAFRGGAGRILTNTAPFTTEYLNSALEELQDKIGNNGVITLTRDNVILGPIPALPSPDPSMQVNISYNGISFMGDTAIPSANIPVLPSDLVSIFDMWERQVGSGLPFKPMIQPPAGLPSILQGSWLNFWEYREDGIWFTGSTQTEEVRIRYQVRQVPISAAEAPELANVQIGILASVNALATLVAYNYARARGSVGATTMAQDAEKMMRYIVRRYTRRGQRIQRRRGAYGEAGNRMDVRLPY